jgi:hypothetical protein
MTETRKLAAILVADIVASVTADSPELSRNARSRRLRGRTNGRRQHVTGSRPSGAQAARATDRYSTRSSPRPVNSWALSSRRY